MTRMSTSLWEFASPRACEPKRITRDPSGAAAPIRRPASAIVASSIIGQKVVRHPPRGGNLPLQDASEELLGALLLGVVEDRFRVALLDHDAAVHEDDLVADLAGEADL